MKIWGKICSLPLQKNIKRVVQGFMHGGRLPYCLVLLWKFVNLLATLPGKMRSNEYFPLYLYFRKKKELPSVIFLRYYQLTAQRKAKEQSNPWTKQPVLYIKNKLIKHGDVFSFFNILHSKHSVQHKTFQVVKETTIICYQDIV